MDEPTTSAEGGTVTVRLFAAARAAAGAGEVVLPAGPVDGVVAALLAARPELGGVLPICTLLLDGARLDPASREPLGRGAVVDVLPPFAGG